MIRCFYVVALAMEVGAVVDMIVRRRRRCLRARKGNAMSFMIMN